MWVYNTGLLLAGNGAGSAAAWCRENAVEAAMGVVRQPGQESIGCDVCVCVCVCQELGKEEFELSRRSDEQLWIKLGISRAPQPFSPSAHANDYFY